jgi:hypothetical protein
MAEVSPLSKLFIRDIAQLSAILFLFSNAPSVPQHCTMAEHNEPGSMPNKDYSHLSNVLMMPLMPSQLLESYQTTFPPSHLYTEKAPVAGPTFSKVQDRDYLVQPVKGTASEPSSAEQANQLINQALGRKSAGSSVVEPDSVLGESGRLYHGYKEGRYFLPNDAVSTTWLTDSSCVN